MKVHIGSIISKMVLCLLSTPALSFAFIIIYLRISSSYTILLWGIRNYYFIYNTIATAKFSHGLVDEFRTYHKWPLTDL